MSQPPWDALTGAASRQVASAPLEQGCFHASCCIAAVAPLLSPFLRLRQPLAACVLQPKAAAAMPAVARVQGRGAHMLALC